MIVLVFMSCKVDCKQDGEDEEHACFTTIISSFYPVEAEIYNPIYSVLCKC